ncbi:hypothetical protein [Eubacterium ramulus]|uniref:hypothetical protein n=1 Tax=Eubacterium ramulus TaxID=39490 RepID=UPI0022E8BDB2|nr:hypothetical protein [Eubacterium ramulus]
MEYFEVFIKIVEVICKIVSAINTGGRFIFYIRKERSKCINDENVDKTKSTSPAATGEADALHE